MNIDRPCVALLVAFAFGALAGVGKASAASALPVYPGAVLLAYQMPGATKICGHMLTMKSYHAPPGASFTMVVAWYEQRLPGGAHLDFNVAGAGRNATVFARGGADAAAVTSVAGETNIALEHFNPAYAPDEISEMNRAEHGDAAARAQIKAKFHCNDD